MPYSLIVRPRGRPTDAVDRDAHDLSSRRIVHGRELHVGAEVHVGEPLEQISRAAFCESRPTVDDEVLLQPPGGCISVPSIESPPTRGSRATFFSLR